MDCLQLQRSDIAKLVAAVLVIIANYVLSKLLVFRKAKAETHTDESV